MSHLEIKTSTPVAAPVVKSVTTPIIRLSFLSFFLVILLFGRTAFCQESSARLRNPFLLPQTSFVAGNANYTLNSFNPNGNGTVQLDETGITTFGFDIEVNAARFMNIGGYFRVESISSQTHWFATILGGFTRFFYVPPFLEGKSFTGNIFTRLELGAGPTIMRGPSGILGTGGVHFGVETYFSKWIGVSVSYGFNVEFVKETLLTGANINPGSTFRNEGRIFLVGLKTTFL